MDPSYLYAVIRGHKLMDRQFHTPEWQHRVALAALREPWHRSAARWAGRMKSRAGRRPAVTVAAQEVS